MKENQRMIAEVDNGPGPIARLLNGVRDAAKYLSDPPNFFRALAQNRFARRIVGKLLACHAAVRAESPSLQGEALYREVLLRSGYIAAEQLDDFLSQADDSVDEWTAPGREQLGFRELVHFLVMQRFLASGQAGSVVSFGDIVNSLVPAEL
jgi:hypothetical protein